tara:strand:+ start:749 stop:1003 length:255 start_codon:yes stop_codon:yes gene_type:complete
MEYKKEDLLASLGDVSDNTQPVQAAEQVQTLGASADEIQALAKQDLDFLAALVMPLIFTYCYPPVFKAVWQWLLDYIAQHRTFP